MTRSRTTAILLLLAALAAGGAIGYAAGEARHGHRHGSRSGPDGYIGRLTEALDLDPAQQDSIKAMLDRRKPAYDSMWQEQRLAYDSIRARLTPRRDTLRAQLRSEIRALLRPDQQERYDDYLARLDAERRHRESRNDRT